MLAWYKAHATATWTHDATVVSNWNGVGNGAQISIAPPEVKANGVQTVIEISKK